MAELISGQIVLAGEARGITLVSTEPLSFWGGYDHRTGEITDRRHPLSGQIAAHRILALPFSRGSSTTAAVLLEAIRAGTAPAAIITTGVDTFFALAAVVARQMYGISLPLLAISAHDFARLRTGMLLGIDGKGCIHVEGP